MASQQFKKPHESWSNGSRKCSPVIAAQRALALFGCYRREGANDPEIYTTAVTAVLSEFPQDVIEYVTDPRTGIAGEIQWLPSVAEVKTACVKRQEHLDRLADFDLRFGGRRPVYSLIENRAPGRRANVFVHADAPQYLRCLDLIKTADPKDWKHDEAGRPGVWIALNLFRGDIARKDEPFPSRDELIKQIGAAAFDALPHGPQQRMSVG